MKVEQQRRQLVSLEASELQPEVFRKSKTVEELAKRRDEAREKFGGGGKRRQAVVVIMCWLVGRAQSRSSGRGVFLGRRGPWMEASETGRRGGLAAKARLGGLAFGEEPVIAQQAAYSIRLGQGLCFGYAPVAWVGGVGRSLALDVHCRLPTAKRIGRRRKDFPRGVGAGDGVEDGARKQQTGSEWPFGAGTKRDEQKQRAAAGS